MINQLQQKFNNLEARHILQLGSIIFALVLLLLTCLLIVDLYLSLTQQPEHTIAPVSPQQSKDYNAQIITSNHLFGEADSNTALENNQVLPETRLQLTLRGAFTSSNPKMASAIIQGPDGESRSYKVDSRVYNSATLHEVFADRVVLSRNGQLETLYFPEPDFNADSGAVKSSVNNVSNRQNNLNNYDIPDDARRLVEENMSLSEIKEASKQLTNPSMTPEQRQALIRQRLQDLRNRANRKQ